MSRPTRLTLACLLFGVTLVVGGIGCAARSPSAVEPARLAVVGTDQSASDADDETPVRCKCGTWAGTKGAATNCKKTQIERKHQRELATTAKDHAAS